MLKCGDYAEKYGSVIVLEDDLYVSPFFYVCASAALDYYEKDERIAGISLFNLPYSQSWKLPFVPLQDDSDVYFKQVPASLGLLDMFFELLTFKS